MRRCNIDTRASAREPQNPQTRSARRRVASLALLLGVVASALSGCIWVPVGGYGYDHGGYYHPYYHHYYYRD